jgi:cellulose synthase/poly-beta-1,6-N-acetylglucosamine synthase-like glycosyltransferase
LSILEYNIVFQSLIAVYGGCFIIQIIYWSFVFPKILFYKPVHSNIKRFPVSVIICARDEEANLRANLPLILEQDYPEYEVVVVNDASTDGTEGLLIELQRQYSHLRSTFIREGDHIREGKKLALTVGIKAAKYDWLLLTDADCSPASNHWIYFMQRNFTGNNQIVLGYGGYRRRKGLVNLISRYEAFFIALQYFGMSLAGHPYMGTGRNLAYRRALFFENKGFAAHYELASGDDDLFINEVARKANTAIEIRGESFTWSDTEKTWKDWYYQKKRHLTTGSRYRFVTKLVVGLELMSRMLFYPAFIVLLVSQVLTVYVLGLFIFRMLLTSVIIKLAMVRLHEKYLLLPSPLLDFGLPWVHLFMVFSNYVATKRARWK